MVDRDYWSQNHPHPLAPNQHDVEVYQNFVAGSQSILLLGNTPALMSLFTTAMDSDPFLDDPRVICQDWTTNELQYDAIIGDGVLNFTAELADQVLEMAAKHCKVFVARSFNHRLPIMRIADNFPVVSDFEITPTETLKFADYSFFVWRFNA
ncbi:MAG: hypothetical protein RL556_680 [Actinomycetota bacterium]|jgi:hypothetical protein